MALPLTQTDKSLLLGALGTPETTNRVIALLDATAGIISWGSITGTLSDQTDLQSALDAASAGAVWGSITGTLSDQIDLQNALNLKSPLASPVFTGIVTAPTVQGGSAALGALNLSSTSNASKGMIQATDGSSFFIESDPTNTVTGAFGPGWWSPFIFGCSTTSNTNGGFSVLFANVDSGTARGAVFNYASSRGTYSAPAFPLSGDVLCTGVFYGYDGVGYAQKTIGTWALRATENHSASAFGSKWEFTNISTGATARILSIVFEDRNLKLMGTTSANLLWNTDGSGDIGASGATRPNNIFVKTNATIGGVILNGDGVVTAPGYSFSGDPDTGFYRIGANNIGVATNGILRANFSSGGSFLMATGNIIMGGSGLIGATAGSAAAPSYTFSGNTAVGMYAVGTNSLGFTTSGVLRASFDSSGILSVVGQTRVGSLGVGNSAAATTPGTITNKIEVFNAAGASLGFIAVYDAIT